MSPISSNRSGVRIIRNFLPSSMLGILMDFPSHVKAWRVKIGMIRDSAILLDRRISKNTLGSKTETGFHKEIAK